MEEKLKRRKNREIVLARRLRKRPNISHHFTSSTASSTSDDAIGVNEQCTTYDTTYGSSHGTTHGTTHVQECSTKPTYNTVDTEQITVPNTRLSSILSSSPGAFSYFPSSGTQGTRPQFHQTWKLFLNYCYR